MHGKRDQLRWVVGLFTGHCHLKGHLFKLGLTDDLTCERYLEEAYFRFRHMGQFFMEPNDYYDPPINKISCIIRSVRLIKV
jgi:hypothetical protein